MDSKQTNCQVTIAASTEQDRSRTPSPFLSANRHYPWLYGDQGDTGIELDRIKISDNKSGRKDREGRKKQEAMMEAEARAALKAVRSQNEDYEPSEEVPLWEPSEEERKMQPPKVKGFKIDQTRSFLDSKIVSNEKDTPKEKDPADRLSGSHLGLFLDKVISGLKTKTQSAPLPPLPPGPPVPPPSLSKPPPPPSEPHPDTPEPGEVVDYPHPSYSNTNSDINVGEADFDDTLITSIVSGLDPDLEEEEKLLKAKEKLANILIKKKMQPQEKKNGVTNLKSRPALLPHPVTMPDSQYINTFMADWGVGDMTAGTGSTPTAARTKLKTKRQRGEEEAEGGFPAWP